MKTLNTFLMMIGLASATASAAMVNFDDATTGEVPKGWTAAKTGKGEPKWAVVADDSAQSKPNVLKQSGQATYPLAIKDDASLKDGFVEVKFKPLWLEDLVSLARDLLKVTH